MNATTVRLPERSANIFINYRREDSAGHAGRLFDGLSDHFPGRLFMDVDTLEPGVDFVDAIEKAVGSCEVLIVVIGSEWLTLTDATGKRRLDDCGDFVRLEVESALARNIRVIPVLVQDTPMPRAGELPASLARLARRNAIEISDARWAYDVDRLAQTIREILRGKDDPHPVLEQRLEAPPPVPPECNAKPRPRRFVLAAAVLLSVVALATGGWIGGKALTSDGGSAEIRTEGGDSSVSVPPQPATVDPSPSPETGEPIGNTVLPEATETAPKRWPAEKPYNPPPAVVRVPTEPTGIPVTDPPVAPPVHAEAAQPPQATITSPRNGAKVGKQILAEGVLSGLGTGQRVFLCVKSIQDVYYPQGELPAADGPWSMKANSSDQAYEISVVLATSPQAVAALNDRSNREQGLRNLPEGASILRVVKVERKWWTRMKPS